MTKWRVVSLLTLLVVGLAAVSAPRTGAGLPASASSGVGLGQWPRRRVASYGYEAPKSVAGPVSISAAANNNLISVGDGRDIGADYVGDEHAIEAIRAGLAYPRGLASADYDEDGVPDLAACFAGSGGGALVIYRGNIDSIYQDSPEARARKAAGQFTESPFLSPALVIATPDPADFVATGDFDGDGHLDVVTAERGGRSLSLFSGDGQGQLNFSKRVDTSGRLTAMEAGEVNRRDGLADLVVGVEEGSTHEVLVYEGPNGALNSGPEQIALPAPATSLALALLDDDYLFDIAVASGDSLVVVHGRDRRLSLDKDAQAAVHRPLIDEVKFESQVRAIAAGNFVSANLSGMAVLLGDGTIRNLDNNILRRKLSGRRNRETMSLLSAAAGSDKSTKMARARISGRATDDLLLIEGSNQRLQVLNSTGRDATSGATVESALVDVDGEPVAVLPMRLNRDALSDLVILRAGHASPAVLQTQAAMTFTVTNTLMSGAGSFAQAIIDANANPGPDLINFNIPGAGPHFISGVTLNAIQGSPITIDATTQPDFSGLPVVVIVGDLSGTGLTIFSGSSTVRGLVVTSFRTGIEIQTLGGNIIEGNVLGNGGIPLPDTEARNIQFGIRVVGGVGNLVGGTAAPARNVIAANHSAGVFLTGSTSMDTHVQGNYIGIDAGGHGPVFPRQPMGLFVSANSVIGGTQSGAGNVISGNFDGLVILANGSVVQGNLIGTASDGLSPVGNQQRGINAAGTAADPTTIGGTVLTARNLISGNGVNGLDLLLDSAIVQGNLFGTDNSGANPLPNGGFGIRSIAGTKHIIGGTAQGSGNVIAFNGLGGVGVDSSIGNRITGNAIHDNNGLGIDLGSNGPTPNDPGDSDTGANNLQNFPVLTEVSSGNPGRVKGQLNSTPNTQFTIEFFANNGCDDSGFGEGSTFVGDTLVVTDDSGLAIFDLALSGTVSIGEVVTATATDPNNNTSEFSACALALPPTTDLSVTKSASPSSVAPGGSVLYTIAIHNNGTNVAEDVTVTDVTPAHTTFQSIQSPPGWFCVTPDAGAVGSIVCTTGSLAPAGEAALTVTLKIDSDAQDGSTIPNTAAVQSTLPDPDLSNNSSIATTAVSASLPVSDLSITIQGGPDPVASGQRVTYTIVATNSGPDAASEVIINSFTPGGTTFSSAVTSQGMLLSPPVGTAGPITIALGSVPNGGSSTVTLVYNVIAPPGSQLQAAATVAVSALDPLSSNNSASAKTTVTGGGIGHLRWDQSPSSPENPAPSPSNLVMEAGPAPQTSHRQAAQSAGGCSLVGFRVYISAAATVLASKDDLWLVADEQSRDINVPVAPGGAAYAISAVWDCAGNVVESALSNDLILPPGPSITEIAASQKLKISGRGFLKGASVFIDGVSFVKNAKVKAGLTKVIQKGLLTNGLSVQEAIRGRTVVITIRNANGGIASTFFPMETPLPVEARRLYEIRSH